MRGLAGRRTLLLWSGIAIVAMFALAWAVGPRSTRLDRWFHRFGDTPAEWLLVFTNPWVLTLTLLSALAVALYQRRHRLAMAMILTPLVGIVLEQLLKHLIGRMRGDGLAYPSGHTTTAVIVMGMIVLLANASVWATVLATVISLLGMIGQGVTYHYFTDTLGALLLGSAVVCAAAVVAELDRRQPGCDADHIAR